MLARETECSAALQQHITGFHAQVFRPQRDHDRAMRGSEPLLSNARFLRGQPAGHAPLAPHVFPREKHYDRAVYPKDTYPGDFGVVKLACHDAACRSLSANFSRAANIAGWCSTVQA
jgi:hypothetical protein